MQLCINCPKVFRRNPSQSLLLGNENRTLPTRTEAQVRLFRRQNPQEYRHQFDASRRGLRRRHSSNNCFLGNTRTILKSDFLRQAHDIEFAPSLDIVVNEALPVLEEAVKKGKARFIGVTGYPVSTLKECIERSKVKIDIVLSYARLSMLDNTLKQYLPYFQVRAQTSGG